MSKPKTRRLSNSSRSALPTKAAPEYSIPHPDTMPDRYVVHCAGNCMEPDISNGAPVLVEKHGKVAPGDLVVLFFKPEHVPAGKYQAILKRLVMAPPALCLFPLARASEERSPRTDHR
jgi:phage repressor protein C with HTH and peptisase S24 domain